MEAGNTVYTDEHKGYNLIAVEYDQKKVKHSLGEYVDGQIHTNGDGVVLVYAQKGLHRNISPSFREALAEIRR